MVRAWVILSLLAAGCASSPAPIDYGGSVAPAPQAQSQPTNETPTPRPHRASPEPDWAGTEGTPLSTYALRPEEVQPFDPANLPRTHRVAEGETLYEIATRYQIPLRALIDQNALEPPYALPPGRTLQLPPPRFHVVARGESFDEIARRYNVDPRSLALLNRMEQPDDVRVGERLVLPPLARQMPPPQQSRSTQPTPPTQTATAPVRTTAAGQLAWPLRGEIVSQYGPQAGGQRLDGVEIAGRVGAPINAAADGEVVYAGDDLPGYGTLVIVTHADNRVTAYGYARRALVAEGDRVRRGQAIAELGERPNGGARLLFQVRDAGVPVDPAPLLGAN